MEYRLSDWNPERGIGFLSEVVGPHCGRGACLPASLHYADMIQEGAVKLFFKKGNIRGGYKNFMR